MSSKLILYEEIKEGLSLRFSDFMLIEDLESWFPFLDFEDSKWGESGWTVIM